MFFPCPLPALVILHVFVFAVLTLVSIVLPLVHVIDIFISIVIVLLNVLVLSDIMKNMLCMFPVQVSVTTTAQVEMLEDELRDASRAWQPIVRTWTEHNSDGTMVQR